MSIAMLLREPWEKLLASGISEMLTRLPAGVIPLEHIRDTPDRVVKAFHEYFAGCYEDPEALLEKGFTEGRYDEMIFVNCIEFVSFCSHHLIPFLGLVHFAYIPNDRIVGLSKIARLVDVYARRPQFQEQMTLQIADTFEKVVKPKGCGVVADALHMCMCARGVKKQQSFTRTTALRGVLREGAARDEFLRGVPQGERRW